MLEFLALGDDVPETITCKSCGKPMHWVLINKHTGYWLHRGKDIDVCAEKNPLHPGKPLIAQNLQFYNKIATVWLGVTGKKMGDIQQFVPHLKEV